MRDFEALFEPSQVADAPMPIETTDQDEPSYTLGEPDPEADQNGIQWTPELA